MGSGTVKVHDMGDRALYDLKPCPDCKGKKMVSPERAKAIHKSIDKGASRSLMATKRGEVVTLTKPIPDYFEEKEVPEGTYQVVLDRALGKA